MRGSSPRRDPMGHTQAPPGPGMIPPSPKIAPGRVRGTAWTGRARPAAVSAHAHRCGAVRSRSPRGRPGRAVHQPCLHRDSRLPMPAVPRAVVWCHAPDTREGTRVLGRNDNSLSIAGKGVARPASVTGPRSPGAFFPLSRSTGEAAVIWPRTSVAPREMSGIRSDPGRIARPEFRLAAPCRWRGRGPRRESSP